jgi:hypothetical protein
MYQSIFAPHILICKLRAILVNEREVSSDFRPSYAFRCFSYALALETGFFVAEIEDQASTGGNKEETCFQGEGLGSCQIETI